jgi:opacity protein-like surface antigen
MKRFLGFAVVLVLLTASAFAAKNSENVNISQPVTVGTTQLPAAQYKVTWTGTGSTAQVTLTNGKSTVTVPAKVVDQKNGVTSVLTDSKSGSAVLQGINLKQVTLVFSNSPSSGQ